MSRSYLHNEILREHNARLELARVLSNAKNTIELSQPERSTTPVVQPELSLLEQIQIALQEERIRKYHRELRAYHSRQLELRTITYFQVRTASPTDDYRQLIVFRRGC
jgi:hypothetical protein